MASDDILEESSNTIYSSSDPFYERMRDKVDTQPFLPSDQTALFHPGGIIATQSFVHTQGIPASGLSTDLHSSGPHFPPVPSGNLTPSLHESISSEPPSHVTAPEVSVFRPLSIPSIPSPWSRQATSSALYPQGPCHPVIQPNLGSLSSQQMSLQPGGRSPVSFIFSSEIDHQTSFSGAEPQFWTGAQPPDPDFLDNHPNPQRGPTSLTAALGLSTSPSTTAQPITGAEDFQISSGEILVHSQGVDRRPNPTSSITGRKRRLAPDTSNMGDRPPKRSPGVGDRVTQDIQEEALMNNVTSADRSLLYQSRSSHATTPPTTAEVQRLEPIEYIHDTRQTNGGEFFREASNIVMRDSKMTAVGVQHVYVQGGHPNDATLQWLRGYAMKGAEHDSADRDPPPRCHPGTRTTIIQNVQGWLGNSEREKDLLWLWGTAGAGKSAIVQTLAEALSEEGRLGASLFFSRPNGRDNPRQIFPTLAYQFAIQDPSYREYIRQFVLTNPESLDKAMNEQFRTLIVEPFVHKGVRSGKVAWVVTLDGLDECGEDPNGRRHSNDAQREVVHLIGDFVRQYPTAPLIWIIASRPETHLKATFSKPDVVRIVWEEEVPVDSDEACEDVEKFLHKEFMKISEDYPDHIRNIPWPTSKQFLKIAQAALGLFIFAEIVVRFIGDPEVGNPIAQLERVLLAISKMRSNNRENPLANLDVIYIAILSKIPPNSLQVTKRFLGFLIFLTTAGINISQCNFRCMCQILDISEDIAITALRQLHSVLYFPKVKDLGKTRPRFYHASFRDFLEDESRSHEYFIDKQAFTLVQLIQDIIRIAQAQFSSCPDLSSEGHEDRPEDCVSKFVEFVLCGALSPDGIRFREHQWITDSLPNAQLQPLLENLNVLKVMKYATHALGSYYTYLREGDEHELIRRGFLSWTTFGSLDINWDTVSMSILKMGEFRHVHVDTVAGIENKPSGGDLGVQATRSRLRAVAPDTKVKVWGHSRSNCRAAVVVSEERRYAITGVSFPTT